MNDIAMNSTRPAAELSGFKSVGYKVANLHALFPQFSGQRIMMMPFHAHDVANSLPQSLQAYKPLIQAMIDRAPGHVIFPEDATAYLTIDEMELHPGKIQRKSGLHVDGMYQGELAGAWGGGGGGWGSCGNGMLLASNTDDLCKMWTGEFAGVPVNDGDCEHLRDQLPSADCYAFQAGDVIWADGLMVHESYPATKPVNRQFIRVSLPNNAPWFVGYTPNPLGIVACGPIIDQPRI